MNTPLNLLCNKSQHKMRPSDDYPMQSNAINGYFQTLMSSASKILIGYENLWSISNNDINDQNGHRYIINTTIAP